MEFMSEVKLSDSLCKLYNQELNTLIDLIVRMPNEHRQRDSNNIEGSYLLTRWLSPTVDKSITPFYPTMNMKAPYVDSLHIWLQVDPKIIQLHYILYQSTSMAFTIGEPNV